MNNTMSLDEAMSFISEEFCEYPLYPEIENNTLYFVLGDTDHEFRFDANKCLMVSQAFAVISDNLKEKK